MTELAVEILGCLAAVCTTLSFLPQVIRTWKTKSVNDISLGMYLVFCTGLMLWLAYGLFINSLPIIAANGVTLVLAGSVLIMRLVFSRTNAD